MAISGRNAVQTARDSSVSVNSQAVSLARCNLVPAFSSGALSVLKWLGLALMVLDHVDAFVFGRSLTWAGDLGRLVFPIFAVVIGYNLARPTVDSKARRRVLFRLVLFGLLALPFHAVLASQAGGWWPLNIMFTFAAAVAIVEAIERARAALALLLFVVTGALVEYAWPGLALILAVWWLYRWPSIERAGLVLLACGSLVIVNGSMLAMLALLVCWLASGLTVRLPRLKWAFYWFYPAHLAAFWWLLR